MEEQKEEWRDIAGYEGVYQVSNLGRVRSLQSGDWRILKGILNSGGYLQAFLFKEKRPRNFLVHRLVARAFLSNYDEAKDVDHINQVKDDNHIRNLRMASRSENKKNSKKMNRVNGKAEKQSKFKGVRWCKRNKKWRVRIRVDGKMKSFGYYENEEDAGRVAYEAYLAQENPFDDLSCFQEFFEN